MLDAYCLPLSAAPGEPVSLHVSGDVGSCSIEVARDGADRQVVWRADAVEIGLHPTPADAAATGCGWPAAIEIPLEPAWRSGYYAVTLAAGDERADACFVIRPAPRGPRADPARARHHHVERLQRLGRAVPVHRWDTRLVRATVREGVPGEAGAGRADDADRARPRGDGVPELGAAARPVGLERRRRLVELGAAVPALGGVERLPDRRRDLTRPRHAPRDPGRAPADPPRGP